LVKCTEWTSELAIPALRGAGLLVDQAAVSTNVGYAPDEATIVRIIDKCSIEISIFERLWNNTQKVMSAKAVTSYGSQCKVTFEERNDFDSYLKIYVVDFAVRFDKCMRLFPMQNPPKYTILMVYYHARNALAHRIALGPLVYNCR
jgi:hypothetical protein